MRLVSLLLNFYVRALTLNFLVIGESHIDTLITETQRTALRYTDTSPCHVTTTERDVIVDCANKNLNHIKPEWFPLKTTILYLEGNLLDSIPDGIFENCSQLQTLNLNNNKIKTIMPRAFLGLHKLENLDLGSNRLDICDEKFPKGAFEQLDNLKVLDLVQNLQFFIKKYCYDFIGNIVSLTSLSINTRGKQVYFGEEFQNLTKLEKLIITGDAEIITDDSFKYLQTLRYLDLVANIINVSINSLKPLTMLDQLYMSFTSVGVAYTLRLLHPFVGRNMTTIYFKRIFSPIPRITSDSNIEDGILNANKTAILRQICVSDFSLIYSMLFYLEIDALTSNLWEKCLQNLDLSQNPWKGSRRAFMILTRLSNLRSLVVKDVKRNCLKNKLPTTLVTFPKRDLSLQNAVNLTKIETHEERKKFWRRENGYEEFSNEKMECVFNENIRYLMVNYNDTLTFHPEKTSSVSNYLIISISKKLTFVDVSRSFYTAYMELNIKLQGAENVEYIDLSDSGFERLTGTIVGLERIKTFILSGNDLSILSPMFFDTFTPLETLAVANCNFELGFISTQGTRVLLSLRKLKRLDLSLNSLSILPQDMFRTNQNLTELSLSGNRFSEIPFSLTNTPKLSRLDIRYNAITSLQPHVTDKLELLVHKWGKFELFLDGNILSCACQNIKFLQWLRLTAVTLDRDGNFTCINEQGVLTYTDVYIDLEGFWRQCWGQFFFYVSLILFSLMTIGFLCAFVINKYRTYIVSQLLGIFFGFRQHLPGDYKIGVFFAYEDLDYQFVTGDLKRFVEQRLGISTYIRHRDLDPGVVLGEAIAKPSPHVGEQ